MSSIMKGLVDEGMPTSIIKHKQKLGSMKDHELRQHFEKIANVTGKTPEEVARQTAWRHGHGKNSDHYWKRIATAAKPLDEEEGKVNKADHFALAWQEALKVTKGIKYAGTVNDIIVQIQMIAKKYGVEHDTSLELAIDAVREADNALESAVYGLDEVFKDLYQDAKTRQEDEESGLNDEIDESTLDENRYVVRSKDGIEKAFPSLHGAAENWQNSYQSKAKPKVPKAPKGPTASQIAKQIAAATVDQMEYAVGESFPDGDPRDIVIPWIRKQFRKAGITDEFELERGVYQAWDLAEKLFKKRNGTDYDGYMAQIWDDQAGDNPDGFTKGRENPWKTNESAMIDENVYSKYPVTYVKMHKHPTDASKVDHVEMHHANYDFKGEQPTTPERVKHLIHNSDKHKALTSAGYKVDAYGTHKKPDNYYTHPVKFTNESTVFNPKRKKSRNTIVIRPDEYKILRQAKMQGKFNYDFTKDPASDEVTFNIPKNEEIKFCKAISKFIDFGATTASEVFGFDPVKFLMAVGESSIMKGIQTEAYKAEMDELDWAKVHGHRAGKKGSPHTDNPYGRKDEKHAIWKDAWKKARGKNNETK